MHDKMITQNAGQVANDADERRAGYVLLEL